jgi:two-component system response regulator YesN
MPGMDGLELLDVVRREHPKLRVVLLSGFDDFAYAKRGLELDAEGYILKLTLEKDIEAVFPKIARKLAEEETRGSEGVSVQAYEVAGRDTWTKILEDGLVKDTHENSAVLPETVPSAGSFCVCVLDAFSKEGIPFCKAWITEARHRLPGIDVIQTRPGELRFALILISRIENDKLQEKAERAFHAWSECLPTLRMKEIRARCSVGIGTVGQSPWHLPNSYREALSSAETRSNGTGLQVWRGIRSVHSMSVDRKEILDLMSSVVWGDVDAVARIGESLFRNFLDPSAAVSIAQARVFVESLLGALVWRVGDNSLLVDSTEKMLREAEESLRSLASPAEFARWLIDSLVRITSEVKTARSNAMLSEVVSQVRRYIDERFHEKISLERLSEFAGISPSYLSVQFKRLTGKSFSQYLMDVRMTRARELLSGGYKVMTVAEMVGYDDYHHFSKMFKKYFNQSPIAFKP